MSTCVELAIKFGLIPYKCGRIGDKYAVLGGENACKPSVWTFTSDRVISEKKFESLTDAMSYFAVNFIEIQ